MVKLKWVKYLLFLIVGFILLGLYLNESKAKNSLIEKLRLENQRLKYANDSIRMVNKDLDNQININDSVLKLKENKLKSLTEEIKNINTKKDEVNNFVNNLSNDSLANEFTKYLIRREGKSSSNR